MCDECVAKGKMSKEELDANKKPFDLDGLMNDMAKAMQEEQDDVEMVLSMALRDPVRASMLVGHFNALLVAAGWNTNIVENVPTGEIAVAWTRPEEIGAIPIVVLSEEMAAKFRS